MIFNIYTILVIISLIMIIVLTIVGQKLNITHYILLFVTILISNLGDYTISVADSINMALVGQSMVYLGGVFIPIMVLFSTMKLCKMRIPTALWSVLLALAGTVLTFVFTVDKSQIFYKKLTLGKANGMTILIKERGPMHNLYMLLVFGCVIMAFTVSIYSIFKKKKVSYKTITFLLLVEAIACISYLVERIAGLDFELVPFAYIFAEVIFIWLIRKIGRYEITESIAATINEKSNQGYIVFNKKGQYIGSNEAARKFFPNLSEQRIDSYITEENAPVLYAKFVKRILSKGEAEYEGMVEKEGRILKCNLKTIHRGRKRKPDGYVVEMQDDTQQQTYLRLLDNYNADLQREVRQKTEHIDMMQEKIILGMADMIESRDGDTGGHVKRTSAVIRIFTDELKKREMEYGFSEEFLANVVKAAPMHDLGKIAIDDRILRKPGKVTEEEFEEMQTHAERGAEIVGQILESLEDEEFVRIAKNVAHYHHEKWNGKGYPTKIAGIEIPPEARIMALADVFDALVSKRSYKEKMDYDEVFEIIEESIGTHFDPELGKMFLRCRPKLEAYYNSVQ